MTQAEKYRIDPDMGWICMELGLIHRSRKEPEPAIRFLNRAAELFRHYSYFHQLARSYLDAVTASASGTNVIVEASAPIGETVAAAEPEDAAGGLAISLLGPLSIRQGGKELKLQRKSSLQLMICLAAHYHKKLPKDQLLEELFPEGDYVSRNNRFYVVLSALRRGLEPVLKRRSSLILQSGELYWLDADLCTLDLAEFDHLIKQTGVQPERRLELLLQAEKLYRGDLLEEYPYEPSIEPVRERVKQAYLQLLREIGQIYWQRKEYRQGMQAYERILEKDGFAEPVYWEYIRLLVEQGFWQNAKHIAGHMQDRLEKELGVPVWERLLSQFPEPGNR